MQEGLYVILNKETDRIIIAFTPQYVHYLELQFFNRQKISIRNLQVILKLKIHTLFGRYFGISVFLSFSANRFMCVICFVDLCRSDPGFPSTGGRNVCSQTEGIQ